jgi:hypothetical protein
MDRARHSGMLSAGIQPHGNPGRARVWIHKLRVVCHTDCLVWVIRGGYAPINEPPLTTDGIKREVLEGLGDTRKWKTGTITGL